MAFFDKKLFKIHLIEILIFLHILRIRYVILEKMSSVFTDHFTKVYIFRGSRLELFNKKVFLKILQGSQ